MIEDNGGSRINADKHGNLPHSQGCGPRTQLGGSLVGVWNGWGYGIAFFRALKYRSLKFGIYRSFCGISGMFMHISASEKYLSDSGKWPFHTPSIHTPTKCRPNNQHKIIVLGPKLVKIHLNNCKNHLRSEDKDARNLGLA